MKQKQIAISTSKGMLRAVLSEDQQYPGIMIYLADELIARTEMYEDDELLRSHLYSKEHDEPIISETLIDFNKEEDSE